MIRTLGFLSINAITCHKTLPLYAQIYITFLYYHINYGIIQTMK